MKETLKNLHEKAQTCLAKGDQEMHDYLLSLSGIVEQHDMLRHHFEYFVMHAQAVVPYDSQPKHFREALIRAKHILEEVDAPL